MDISFLLAAAYVFLAIYFFIPLLLGTLILIASRGAESRPFPRSVGVAFLVAGLVGAWMGVPIYYGKFHREQVARQHFSNLCETRATIDMPRIPTPAPGIVWLDRSAERGNFLSASRDDLLGPRTGGYQAVELGSSESTEYQTAVWDPERSGPDRALIKYGSTSQPTLPFSVRTVPITTEEDVKQGVRGIETTITNLKTHTLIARRVVFARYADPALTWQQPTAICPESAAVDCTRSGCSVSSFVLKAVPPILPKDLRHAFDLYRGSGKGSAMRECNYDDLSLGPEISLKDVEWWADGPKGWETLNLRIKGTRDHLICDKFFWGGGGTSFPLLRFADTGSKYSSAVIFNSWLRGSEASPRNLADNF